MISKPDKNAIRVKRHERMRFKLSGTPERPRLNVYRSLNHIYTQIIDDVNGVTIVAASTVEKEIAAKVEGKTKTEAAKIVGKAVAERALEKGIKSVVFDRGGYIYTGRVQAIADGAREAGLEF
ncbi:MAG: 50S ribosomal protein L18 [Clostridiales bacterium]|jgi:large subunit ribosomal protein L18|nr:50S ribosomal protein L18 [Clostridiales bacterium]HOB64584.1 50S ribosomal protein L18 [Clostridia bacterium]HOK81960.1 50S ribosomal protein L18 [Clostridia bacterium]HOL61226.1 50S ribosomal protein L18 [Clostridia bacterium]HPO53904.1 50S ribosomal protein L18 [Clostridia bacterium]